MATNDRPVENIRWKIPEKLHSRLFVGLNENGPCRLIRSGNIENKTLSAVGVALLENLCFGGMDFEASEAQTRPSIKLYSCCLLNQIYNSQLFF